MSTPPTQWVIVDDTSLDINYLGGSWATYNTGLDTLGTDGTPYRNTAHRTTSSASLSFPFTGSAVSVYGTVNARTADSQNPKWECFVDGKSISSNNVVTPVAQNNINLCGPPNQVRFNDGPHTLTVNVTITNNEPFYLDYILYVPPVSLSLANKTARIDPSGLGFRYGTGWKDVVYDSIPAKLVTQRDGSDFTLDFYGTSLAWYGLIPGDYPGTASQATYTIDSGPLQYFNLNGHNPTVSNTSFHQKLFDTGSLPLGKHNIFIIHRGDATTTPLTLQYLVIENGTSPTLPIGPTASGSPFPSPSSTSSGNTSTKSKSNAGAIAGGVVGGIAFFAILGILLLFLRRRNTKKKQVQDKLETENSIDPFPASPRIPSLPPHSPGTTTISPSSASVSSPVKTQSPQSPGSTSAYTPYQPVRKSDLEASTAVARSHEAPPGLHSQHGEDMPPEYTPS